MKITGVYIVKSKIDPKFERVLADRDCRLDWFNQRELLKLGTHPDKELQNHVIENGIDDLIMDIEKICTLGDDLKKKVKAVQKERNFKFFKDKK